MDLFGYFRIGTLLQLYSVCLGLCLVHSLRLKAYFHLLIDTVCLARHRPG